MTTTQPVQTAYQTIQQQRYRIALILSIIDVLNLNGQTEAAEIVSKEFGENAD